MAGGNSDDTSAGEACGAQGPALRRARGNLGVGGPPSAVSPTQRARGGAPPPPPARRSRRLAFVACAVGDSGAGGGSVQALVATAGQQITASSLVAANHTPAECAPACRVSPRRCLPGETATAAAGAQ